MGQTPSQRRLRWLLLAAACVTAIAGLYAAYSNHFDNSFHFDDSHVILNNLAIRSLHDVPGFFTDPQTFTARPENAVYRPLLTLSHALDYAIGGGLDPRQFHRTQFALLLLLGATLVAFFKHVFDRIEASRWNIWTALAASLFFCIHTANTETVNYISSRSSLVATLSVVGAFLIWCCWPLGKRLHLYLLPVLLGGLAKPLTVMFAPLLLVYVLLFEEDASLRSIFRPRFRGEVRILGASLDFRRGRWTRRVVPAFVAGAALFLFLRRMDADTLLYATVNRWTYLITQPRVWLHYFKLYFWPTGQTADPDWPFVESLRDPGFLVGTAFIALLVVAIFWLSAYRRLRPAAFGLAWFAIALLPTSSVFPLSEVYNEHRIFFPYVGLTLATVWLLLLAFRAVAAGGGRAARVSAAVAVIFAVSVISIHGTRTYARNRVWKDDESLWADVARKSPRNGRGLMNYGLALMRRGQLAEALNLFERALIFNPNYEILHVNLAIVKAALDDQESAEDHFELALRLAPRYARGHYFFAKWLLERGRGPEAIDHLGTALSISPADQDASFLLVHLLSAKGDVAAMKARADQTLSIVPDDPTALAFSQGKIPHPIEGPTAKAYEDFGLTRISQKRWTDAATVYRKAIEIGPETSAAWNNLGWARTQLGFWSEAIDSFENALRVDPQNELAQGNLNWARTQAQAAAGQSPP